MYKDSVLLAHDLRKQIERLEIDNMVILNRAKKAFASPEFDTLLEVYNQEEQDLHLMASLIEKDKLKDAEMLAKSLHEDTRNSYIPNSLAKAFGWKSKGNSYIIK